MTAPSDSDSDSETGSVSTSADALVEGVEGTQGEKKTDQPLVAEPRQPVAKKQGRVGITILGLVLMIAGAAFTGILWRSYQRTAEVRDTWAVAGTRIDMSEVDEVRDSLNSAPTYEIRIRYSYTVDLISRDSYRVVRQDASQEPKITRIVKDKATADALVAKYPVGQNVRCLINPNNPNQAVLEFGGIGSLYSIWFPMLFVVGGLGMIINAWLPHDSDK